MTFTKGQKILLVYPGRPMVRATFKDYDRYGNVYIEHPINPSGYNLAGNYYKWAACYCYNDTFENRVKAKLRTL